MYKIVNGEQVALTQEEIDEFNAMSSPTVILPQLIATALAKINSDDNKIYADVIGNKTTEYLDAAIEAKVYKSLGYPVGVDNEYGLVKAWASAKRWTMQQATDDIISQEAAWKGAAKAIREYRLKAKEDVKRATTVAEVESAMFIWNTFVKNIRTQLGVE